MADLLGLSARIIDSGSADEAVNRVTQELSELADGVALVESFSHVVAFGTDEGLVLFDSSGVATAAEVVEAVRGWSTSAVHTIVYTHGHLDHVGGSGAFVADAERRGHPRPRFVAQERVRDRLARYRLTDGWNAAINERQFGWLRSTPMGLGGGGRRFLPDSVADPDLTYRDTERLQVGGLDFELRHGLGETDDHTWTWVPSARAVCCGDFLIWNFPNAGNPQKVQRYPREWALALREMAAVEPELLLPAHGLPISGTGRIQRVLLDVATTLEDLVERTLEMMKVRRAGVRGAQHLAALRGMVGRQPGPAEAGARPGGGVGGGDPRRRGRNPGPARWRAGLRRGTAPGRPARRVGRPGGSRQQGGARDPGAGIRGPQAGRVVAYGQGHIRRRGQPVPDFPRSAAAGLSACGA